MESLHVDCGSCRVRGAACSDCVISVLLGPVGDEVQLGSDEVGALAALAGGGLMPPLRLIRGAARDSTYPFPDSEDGRGFASAVAFP